MTLIRFSAATLGLLVGCSSAPPPEASTQPPSVARASARQRPFTPESGRLHVDGRHFYDAANHVWRRRGASQFLLFVRYLNGEDISPQLEWLVDRGFNVLRVFGEASGASYPEQYGITNYERPFERADFDGKLHAFFKALEDCGSALRIHGMCKRGPEIWGYVTGGGTRTVNRDVFISGAAIAYMYSAGYTFHFQDGAEGRVPAPAEPVQDGIPAVLHDVAAFLPNDTQLGTPVEPSVGADRAYGVALGDRAWAVVVPKPPSTWVPAPVNGWRLDAVGPVPYIFRLASAK